uniref:Uncharacterized protein n=1 Tax=Vespula pensylvanica TaxID=30213 RepID=A0A834P554_VESPE|nr:hypothetical protein H0235_005642 [Vespula pensylvanica]
MTSVNNRNDVVIDSTEGPSTLTHAGPDIKYLPLTSSLSLFFSCIFCRTIQRVHDKKPNCVDTHYCVLINPSN